MLRKDQYRVEANLKPLSETVRDDSDLLEDAIGVDTDSIMQESRARLDTMNIARITSHKYPGGALLLVLNEWLALPFGRPASVLHIEMSTCKEVVESISLYSLFSTRQEICGNDKTGFLELKMTTVRRFALFLLKRVEFRQELGGLWSLITL